MELFTREQREQLLKNGSRPDLDHKPVVKLFLTNTNCTWLLTELDNNTEGLAYGLCDIGNDDPALTYCYLYEMKGEEKPDEGVELKRDEEFKGKFPISTYALAARTHKRIITNPIIVGRFVLKPVM